MLRSIVMTCILHVDDLFDKMSVMVSRDPVEYLFKYFHLCHCFDVTFHFWKFHGVLGSGLSPDPVKVAQNPESLAQNYLEKSPVAGMPFYGRY